MNINGFELGELFGFIVLQYNKNERLNRFIIEQIDHELVTDRRHAFQTIDIDFLRFYHINGLG